MASAETLNWLELLLKHAYCWYFFLILLLRTSICVFLITIFYYLPREIVIESISLGIIVMISHQNYINKISNWSFMCKIVILSEFNFISGQYGCLFSRCRKYVINSLIHEHFHIGLVIIPRPILARDCVSDMEMIL
jgi:hypothetical protein